MLGLGISTFQLAVRRLLTAILPFVAARWSDATTFNDNATWSDNA